MKYFWVFAFSLVAILGCQSKPKSDSKTLIVGRAGDAVGLDPAAQTDGDSLNLISNIIETLVRMKDGTTEIEPWLAESWTISNDATVYTFTLRPNIVFHDGTPLDADAVLFAFERQSNPKHEAYESGRPYKYWENLSMDDLIKSVEKIDSKTVRVTLKQPNASFLATLTMPFLAIVSPTAVKKLQKGFDRAPVGSGPYQFAQWKKDEFIELKRFDGYWGEKPKIERVLFRAIPDAQVRKIELEKGRIHIMVYPSPQDFAELKANPNLSWVEQEGMNIGYLAFNLEKPPLDQLALREAISLAIDRERILREVFQGAGQVAKNTIPPQVLGYRKETPAIPFDPEKAKALVAKVKNLRPIKLWAMPVSRPYNPNAKKMAEFIQADLKRVGIATEIVSYDWGTYLDKIGEGEHEMVLIGWSGDNGDPDNFFFPLWSKASAMRKPTGNYAFYKNDQIDLWLNQARKESNPKTRAQLYEKVQEQMSKDLPMLPIAHSVTAVATQKNIEGFVIQSNGDWRVAGVQFRDR